MTAFKNQIDHLAIVVKNLPESINYFKNIGFIQIQNITTKQDTPEVISAVMVLGEVRFVLLEPKDPESPLAKYRNKYGEGVHHIAIKVNNLKECHADLLNKGCEFGTPVITSEGLHQVLSVRDDNSGIMLEFTGRAEIQDELDEENFDGLLVELQKSNNF